MQSLADIVMGTVQYNEEGVLMSIKELCSIMSNSSSTYDGPMEAYNRLVKLAQVKHTQTSVLHSDIHEMSVLSHVRERASKWRYSLTVCVRVRSCTVPPVKKPV